MRLLAVVATAAAGLSGLSAGLRPDSFFSGDSGLKLIASLSAIAHPSRPLEIDLPQIGGRPVAYVEHMIAVHDDHGHVLQSPLFPALSAPLIGAFGLRGAYLLPIMSFVALIPLLDAIRRDAAPETSFAIWAWITIAANPVVFYALEYWEHAPAIALLAGSVSAALIAYDRVPSARPWTIMSGALGGCSVLLRPEAAWCLMAMLLIVDRRHWIAFGSAMLAVVAPFALTNFFHSGNFLGPHTSQSLAPLTSDWITARWSRIHAWLWPENLTVAIGLLFVAGAWLVGVAGIDVRIRQLLGLIGTAIVSWAAAELMLSRESLWQGFPVVLLALLPTPSTAIVRRLNTIALIVVAGVLLTATHDGGAQWGPRFVLIAVPLLIVLAARAATLAAGRGRVRVLRVALIIFVLLAGLVTERSSYLELRGSKRLYGQIVSATSTLTQEGDVIVTNVWWFDQVNASLFGRRVFLYVPSVPGATQALNELSTAGITSAALVWTEESDGESLAPALRDTCFDLGEIQSIRTRQVQIARVRCARK